MLYNFPRDFSLFSSFQVFIRLFFLPGFVTSHGSVIVSATANLKASDLDRNVGSFLLTT